ncbi:MAG: hypothetical protein ACOC29_01640 [Candidatus Sumerlaeota bacterium]
MRRRYLYLAISAIVLIACGALVANKLFLPPRSFQPDLVARAETEMWKAYYGDDKTQLGLQLVMLAHQQYMISLAKAQEVARLLASSAMDFRESEGEQEAKALPQLEQAYRLIREASELDFDPEEAARNELEWWVARRTPGRDSPEQVGREIAELYATLYGSEPERYLEAGTLRARAGAVRDAGGKNADWQQVEALLQQSYRKLEEALESRAESR